MRHLLSSLLVLAGLANPNPAQTELRRTDLMSALRAGGYTVVLRHARTDRTVKEDPGSVPKERSDQRNLNEQGVADAKLMGVVFRKYGIRFDEIISSPMFRTVETAEYAAGKPVTTMALRVFPSTSEQAALIAAPPKPGTNRLLVTHHFVIETHVPGIFPGDIEESEAAVIKATGNGKVELVGRIILADWVALAGVGQVGEQPRSGATGNGQAAAGVSAYNTSRAAESTSGSATALDSQEGRIGLAYIEAFNSGPARMRSFIESYLLVDPARPIEERLKSYEKIHESLAPLSLGTGHTSGDGQAMLMVKSKQGDVRLIVKASSEQPGRASSISIGMPQAGGHR